MGDNNNELHMAKVLLKKANKICSPHSYLLYLSKLTKSELVYNKLSSMGID